MTDPSLPTDAHPGSPEKLAVLAARVAAGVELFVEGDAEGARQLNITQPSPVKRCRAEIAILGAASAEEQSAGELAQRAGYMLSQTVYHVLHGLAASGVLKRGEKGWRLAEV